MNETRDSDREASDVEAGGARVPKRLAPDGDNELDRQVVVDWVKAYLTNDGTEATLEVLVDRGATRMQARELLNEVISDELLPNHTDVEEDDVDPRYRSP